MKVSCHYIASKDCWKIKAMEGPKKGKIIGYKRDLDMVWCVFKVDLKKRLEFIRSRKCPNHYWVEGYLVDTHQDTLKDTIELVYDAHRSYYFTTKYNRTTVFKAQEVALRGDKIHAIKGLV